MKPGIIALITDFGTEDGYTGAMKGRIFSNAPETRVVDISHEIIPYDVRQAAFCLHNSYPYFPDKTVFVVVVDPGVGTRRRGVVVKTSQHYFVGPDNGVFSFVYQREGYQAFEIVLKSFTGEISATFHGRDVFAPVAAWLAAGREIDAYLAPLKDVHSFLTPAQRLSDREFQLEVMHIDHFGNLILNFHKHDWLSLEHPSGPHVEIDGIELKEIRKTFGNVRKNELVLLWDSTGFLQIAQYLGNAAEKITAVVGDPVKLWI